MKRNSIAIWARTGVSCCLVLALLFGLVPQAARAQEAPAAAASLYLPVLMGGTGFDYARVFPAGLAVASPLRMVATAEASAASPLGSWTSGYAIAADTLYAVVTGATPVTEVFDPQAFLRAGNDAACYGPTLQYRYHPDSGGTDGSLQELPRGDLGIWLETDSTGDACAAAQLNARLNGAEAQSQAALSLVGAMVAAADSAGLSLPTGGGTLDVTAAMAAAGIPDVVFASATIGYDTGTGTWTYAADFVYTDPSAGTTHATAVELAFTPDASTPATVYEGVMYYRANSTQPWGNCPPSGGGGGSRDVTMTGSLAFDRRSTADMRIQQRSGVYCGHDVDARSGGILDPTLSWGDNYVSFTGNFDPENLAGDYAAAWQAGVHDRSTRVLNVGINDHTPLDGEAYFGYGDRAQVDSDGVIIAEGLYCNWAAPGSTGSLQPYAQRQFVSFNSSTGHFDMPAGGSDVRYAPVNNCQYDGEGAFWYDRNLNLTADETADDLIVMPGSTNPFDLMAALDSDGDGTATILEAIDGRGYNAPVAP